MIGEVIIKKPTLAGNGAAIYVPKRWMGYRVRCEVVRRVSEKPHPLRHHVSDGSKDDVAAD
jgi:predicted mannosyl-3-phosphoglycerate phosphatase (HAD superfamily)